MRIGASSAAMRGYCRSSLNPNPNANPNATPNPHPRPHRPKPTPNLHPNCVWILQVINYLQHYGLVPCLEQPPFAPIQPYNVDDHIVYFFDENEIEHNAGALQAIAAANTAAMTYPAPLSSLALGFMDFCYSHWVGKNEISIMVRSRSETSPFHIHGPARSTAMSIAFWYSSLATLNDIY